MQQPEYEDNDRIKVDEEIIEKAIKHFRQILENAFSRIIAGEADLPDTNKIVPPSEEYQIFLDKSGFPYDLVFISRNDDKHQQLLHIFSLVKHFITDLERHDLIFIHDLGSFKRTPFENYVTRIELDEYSLSAFKFIFREREDVLKIIEEWEAALNKHYENETFDQTKDITHYFHNAVTTICSTEKNVIAQLKDRKASCGFVRPEPTIDVSSFDSKSDFDKYRKQVASIYMVIKKSDKDSFKLDSRKIEEKAKLGEGYIIVRIDIARMDQQTTKFFRTRFVDELANSHPDLEKTAIFKEINQVIAICNNLNQHYDDYTSNFIKKYYSSDRKSWDPENIAFVLTVCSKHELEFGMQQCFSTLYMQCKIDFFFKDLLSLEAVQSCLSNLLDYQLPAYYSVLDILIKTGFYSESSSYYGFSDYKPGEVNRSWEYGLFVEDAEPRLLNYYRNIQGHELKYVSGFIKIPMPNLALYFMLTNYNEEQDDGKKQKWLKIACDIIKKYALIIPEKYKNIFKESRLFTEQEWQQLEQKYKEQYQKQLELAAKEQKPRLQPAVSDLERHGFYRDASLPDKKGPSSEEAPAPQSSVKH